MMAWRDGPGEDRFVTAPKKSLATFQKGLLEIHKLRKDTCLDLLQSNVDSEKSGGEPKSCEDVKAMTADYQRQVQQNKEFLKKVQKRKVTLPLLYNLYAEIGMMRIEEAVTLRNDEIKTFNAAVLESRKVWDKNDTAGIYSVEGTLFFALKEAHYARMINEAESRSNELQLVRQNLACE